MKKMGPIKNTRFISISYKDLYVNKKIHYQIRNNLSGYETNECHQRILKEFS